MAIGQAGEQSEWRTKAIPLSGGMRFDLPPVAIDSKAPGSLIDASNFQTGLLGGYQRINGYQKWDTDVVPGSGRVLGAFVYNLGVIATRGNGNVYYSTGSGWGSPIITGLSGTGQHRGHAYHWSSLRIVIVNSTDYASLWDGSSATSLTNGPSGATAVTEYNGCLFLSQGSTLYGSAPYDESTFDTGSGGFAVVVGDTIQGLSTWRNDLYIFCNSSIYKLSGTSAADYVFSTITSSIGCIFPDTIQEMAGDIYFMSPDGLRTISGTARIGDVNLETVTYPVQSFMNYYSALYAGKQVTSTVIDSRSQYRLMFSDVGDVTSPGLIIDMGNANPNYYSEGQTFEFFKMAGFQASCADHGALEDGVTQLAIHGDYNGYIMRHEMGYSFDGANIPAYIQLPYLVFDDPELRKVLYKLRAYVIVDSNALAQITIQANFDDNDPGTPQPPAITLSTTYSTALAIYGLGTTVYGTSVYGSAAASSYVTNAIGAGHNISVTFSSDDTLPTYTIRTVTMTYAIEARQ